MTEIRETLVEEALRLAWYHTIGLGQGRATPGSIDLRHAASKVLPSDLNGLRALDVGTFDGFWAFEMERLGADVIAADIESFEEVDIPPLHRARVLAEAGGTAPGDRFALAARILGSDARRVGTSVYDLSSERVGGPVDVALIGDLLLHLRDPVAGLERVRETLSPGGRVLVVEQFNVPLSLLRPRAAWASFQALATDFNWWVGNLACLRDWLTLAGFTGVRRVAFFRSRGVRGQRRPHVAYEAVRP